MIALALIATLVTAPSSRPAATDDRLVLDSIADATARGIARFADRRVAIAEGYRRVGTDFPGMGEHWVHPAALLSGVLDTRRPTMLAYATIAGTPTLLGAGYIVSTQGAASADVPGWPTHWHEHSGLLAEASGVRASTRQDAASSTHVWILHIWTVLPNPGGRYHADNWALPFARLGLSVPATVDHDAGQATGLVVGAGDAYLRNALTVTRLRAKENEQEVDASIDGAGRAAAAVLARPRPTPAMSETDLDDLRRIWGSLRVNLVALLGPEVESLLRPPAAHEHPTG